MIQTHIIKISVKVTNESNGANLFPNPIPFCMQFLTLQDYINIRTPICIKDSCNCTVNFILIKSINLWPEVDWTDLEVVEGDVVDEAAADCPGLGLSDVDLFNIQRVGLRVPPRLEDAPHPYVQRLRRLLYRVLRVSRRRRRRSSLFFACCRLNGLGRQLRRGGGRGAVSSCWRREQNEEAAIFLGIGFENGGYGGAHWGDGCSPAGDGGGADGGGEEERTGPGHSCYCRRCRHFPALSVLNTDSGSYTTRITF